MKPEVVVQAPPSFYSTALKETPWVFYGGNVVGPRGRLENVWYNLSIMNSPNSEPKIMGKMVDPLGWYPWIINPIYTLYNGYLWGIYHFKGLLSGVVEQLGYHPKDTTQSPYQKKCSHLGLQKKNSQAGPRAIYTSPKKAGGFFPKSMTFDGRMSG